VCRFALTLRLLRFLKLAGKPGYIVRIVIIGGAAQKGKIQFEDLSLTRNFGTLRAVLQFCQANDVFNSRAISAIVTRLQRPAGHDHLSQARCRQNEHPPGVLSRDG